MNSEMEKDILKVLVTEEELKTRIAELEIGRASCRERV